jgi:hypothetical protein
MFLMAAAAAGRAQTASAQPPPAPAAPAPVSVLTDTSDATTVFVRVGDVVGVRLTERAPGAAWSVKTISSDGAVLLGSFGNDATQNASTASFKAVQTGVVTITLVNLPSGTTDGAPIALFSFTLNVQSAGSPASPTLPNSAKFVPTSFQQSTGSGIVQYQNGSAYDGATAGGLPSGFGTFTYSPTESGNVQRASGTWNGGALANGDVLLRDGTHYYGGLDANGKVDGPAQFKLPNGDVLTTTFAHGAYSGTTTWTVPSPSGIGGAQQSTIVVTVDPPSPALTGPAVETYANGTKLVAPMQNGEFEGAATFTSPSFGRFTGTFHHGILQESFRWNDSDGNTITGFMRDGVPAGSATLVPKHGKTCIGRVSHLNDDYQFDAFTGAWDRDNRPNGRGTYGCAGSEQLTGQWSHGKMVGFIIDRLPNGAVYKVDVGRTPSETLTGRATVRMADGDIAHGFLRPDGALDGPGSYTFADGSTAQGTWRRGVFKARG